MRKNIAASVKQRLLNIAVKQKEDFNLLQVRYATERLLYRLSVSAYNKDFLLKGAVLFVLWESHPHRPTRDIDLLSLSDKNTAEIEAIFGSIVSNQVPDDGLVFDPDSINAEEIREDNAYGGIRVKLLCKLGSARIPVQVDVGLGDAVFPEPKSVKFPVLLDFPSPEIRAYPVSSVIAEKFQAMVELEERNSRMKDYFDLHYLLRRFEFDRRELAEAIRLTFQRRRTVIPSDLPVGLSEDFYSNEQKQIQWRAFLRKNSLPASMQLKMVCEEIANFLIPVLKDRETDDTCWKPGKGWI